jgi:hypothetical protein
MSDYKEVKFRCDIEKLKAFYVGFGNFLLSKCTAIVYETMKKLLNIIYHATKYYGETNKIQYALRVKRFGLRSFIS